VKLPSCSRPGFLDPLAWNPVLKILFSTCRPGITSWKSSSWHAGLGSRPQTSSSWHASLESSRHAGLEYCVFRLWWQYIPYYTGLYDISILCPVDPTKVIRGAFRPVISSLSHINPVFSLLLMYNFLNLISTLQWYFWVVVLTIFAGILYYT